MANSTRIESLRFKIGDDELNNEMIIERIIRIYTFNPFILLFLKKVFNVEYSQRSSFPAIDSEMNGEFINARSSGVLEIEQSDEQKKTFSITTKDTDRKKVKKQLRILATLGLIKLISDTSKGK